MAHLCLMAVRLVKLIAGGAISWPHLQSIRARSIWVSPDHDFLPHMDDYHDIHSSFRAIPARSRIWRGDVRRFMGCLPGKLFLHARAMMQLTFRLLVRPFPQRMLVKLFLQSCGHTLLRMFACAGALVSSSRLVSSALSQASMATWLGSFLLFFNGFGQFRSSSAVTSLLNHRGML